MAEGLFDIGDEVEPEVREGLVALRDAHEMNVPYPYSEQQDLSLLRRIKNKYPDLDVNDLVAKFLVWCTDTTPWVDEKGKPTAIRWRSRLWTWAVNDERYGTDRRGGSGRHATVRTHHAATRAGHGDATESLERW